MKKKGVIKSKTKVVNTGGGSSSSSSNSDSDQSEEEFDPRAAKERIRQVFYMRFVRKSDGSKITRKEIPFVRPEHAHKSFLKAFLANEKKQISENNQINDGQPAGPKMSLNGPEAAAAAIINGASNSNIVQEVNLNVKNDTYNDPLTNFTIDNKVDDGG